MRNRKLRKRVELFDVCNTILLLIILFVMLYPMYFTVIASISEPGAVASGKVLWKPVAITLDSYRQVFAYKQIWTGYANAIFYTFFGTLFNLLLTIPAAYVVSKKRLPYRRFIMMFFLITMYFGGGMVPGYLQMKDLNLLNTRLVLVIASGVSIYNLIVTRTYFTNSVPESLYEAADLDGAGELRKFFSIALPLAKPIIAVMTLYYAVQHWNGYFEALLYISSKELEPLQLVLRKVLIMNQNALSDEVKMASMSAEELINSAKRAYIAYTMKYAMVFIGSAPLLIAYPFVQKYFVHGVMIGAVKE